MAADFEMINVLSNRHYQFIKHLYNSSHIQCIVLNSDYKLIYESQNETHENEDYKDLYQAVEKKQNRFMVIQLTQNMVSWAFIKDSLLFCFGPMSTVEVRNAELMELSHRYHMEASNLSIPKAAWLNIISYIRFSYWGITDVQLDEKESSEIEGWEDIHTAEITNYGIIKYQEGIEHLSYQIERDWYSAIVHGDSEEMSRIMPKKEVDNTGDIGILAKNNAYKQQEYAAISAIALATRAAIEGGVSPQAAYENSDILLQRVAAARDIIEIGKIVFEASRTFIKLVKNIKESQRQDLITEQIKSYISQNLSKPISIGRMAEELDYSRSYISAHFSKMNGMPIKTYITQCRVIAAANMLKYSGQSIGDISDYMQFSNPSLFSKYFKELYGMSPMEYRKKNKDQKFM